MVDQTNSVGLRCKLRSQSCAQCPRRGCYIGSGAYADARALYAGPCRGLSRPRSGARAFMKMHSQTWMLDWTARRTRGAQPTTWVTRRWRTLRTRRTRRRRAPRSSFTATLTLRMHPGPQLRFESMPEWLIRRTLLVYAANCGRNRALNAHAEVVTSVPGRMRTRARSMQGHAEV
jgi:hypothetical protein